MAVPTEFVNNAASGVWGTSTGIKQGLLETSTTQQGPIGAVMRFADGEAYRYAYFSGAVPQGKLAAIDATSMVVLTSNACFVNAAGTAADYVAAAETVYLKNSNITTAHSDNILAGGKLYVTDESSEGYRYKIRGNTFTVSTSVLKLELYDGLVELIDSEDSAAVIGCKYNNCVIYNAGTDDIISGVTVVDMAAGEYGWIQTWGDGCCLTDGAGVAGTICSGSDGVDGAVQPLGGADLVASEESLLQLRTEPVVGYYLTAVPTTEYAPINIQLAP